MLSGTLYGSLIPRLAKMSSYFIPERPRTPPAQIPIHADVPELKDAEIAAVYYGQRMGGDFYDFIRVSPTRVIFGLMDAAGKVEQSRGILSAAQRTFRSVAARLFATEDVNEADAMASLGIELNRTVIQEAKGIRPCPAFAGCYNENLGIVCYFNAGHTPALLRDKGEITELPATGLPLGLFSHATADARIIALPHNAAMLLVSRGVVEGKRKGEEFGLERVKENLCQSTAETAKEICLNAIDNIKQFMHTAPTHNDVTALALLRSGSASPNPGSFS